MPGGHARVAEMRGWRRKAVIAVGAALGLLLAALWVNSYRRQEVVGWSGGTRAYNVGVTGGSVALRRVTIAGSNGAVSFGDTGWYHNRSRATPMAPAFQPRSCDIYWSLGPFNFLRGGQGSGDGFAGAAWRISGHELIVPFWFVAILLGAVFALLTRLTRAKPMPGCCATCGYDLRASPERCPECGAVA
jgi:hypothetical protein